MTTAASEKTRAPPTLTTALRAGRDRIRRASRVNAMFAGAAGLGALHWLDTAFADPWHGEARAGECRRR